MPSKKKRRMRLTMTNETGKARLFFALPAGGIADCLRPVREELGRFQREIKSVAPENYHITLKFLGETGEETFRRITEDFRALAPVVPPVPFTLKGLGGFPGVRNARVLWCGLDLDREAVNSLQGAIEALSERHGFARETRSFEPHLTLARMKREMKMPHALAEYFLENSETVFGESGFTRIVLFRSELRRDGPLYTEAAEIALK
jgi:RNA 2',3'-cyclic 3'-phosphodiesterase